WRAIPGLWVQGDLASRDGEGLWYLHGRSDDVIKVAGKRTGPSEIESVVLGAGLARDCYIIGVTDAVTGSALVCAYAPLGEEDSADLAARIGAVVVDQCGSAYRPKYYLRVDDLPRTRNEKQMRRVVRSILLGHPVGDVSSCVNPECIDQVRSAARAQLPRL
ncbi:MAG: hypothetical protein K9H11_19105, partial [Rhodospirillum sp.]|nr:hypothetical protein [Rhodospirillum sp.]